MERELHVLVKCFPGSGMVKSVIHSVPETHVNWTCVKQIKAQNVRAYDLWSALCQGAELNMCCLNCMTALPFEDCE